MNNQVTRTLLPEGIRQQQKRKAFGRDARGRRMESLICCVQILSPPSDLCDS